MSHDKPVKMQDKNMLGEFLATILKFIWKMFLWTMWAFFRIVEMICAGLAQWIKNSLMQ